MELKCAVLEYNIEDDLPLSFGRKLRGYFAHRFEDELFHHHTESGELRYAYPLIQYKIVRGNPLIIGLGEACEILAHSFIEVEELKLGDKKYEKPQGNLKVNNYNLSVKEDQAMPEFKYEFITPWLGLNQENYRKYREDIGEARGKEIKKFLAKIMVGNILSFGKGVGWWIENNIIIMPKFKKVEVTFKGKEMLGFVGEFFTNAKLPDYIGLGQATSRGFGTIIKRD